MDVADALGSDALSGASADGVSCKGQTVTLTHKNHSKTTTLWQFISDTVWCYDGTYIVGDPSVEIEVNFCCFWQYRGIINTNETGGDGSTQHYDYRQGHFELCVPKVGCADSMQPWIRKWQYGDGTHTYSAEK